MGSAATVHSLSTYKEERHAFQQQVVNWIEEAFVSIEASLARKIDATTAEAVSLTSQVDELKSALTAAEEAQVRLQEAKQNAQVKQSEGNAKVAEAESTLAEAKRASEDGDAKADAVAAKKAAFEALTAEGSQYATWKTEVAGPKKAVDAFVKSLKKDKIAEDSLTPRGQRRRLSWMLPKPSLPRPRRPLRMPKPQRRMVTQQQLLRRRP